MSDTILKWQILRRLWPAMLAMAAVVVSSNWLVQFPINDWLTYGAFTYPLAFLVSELTNRRAGPQAARQVAWLGFALAICVSAQLAPVRIAAASGLAFLCAQLLDISVFHRLRRQSWWRAPLIASVLASILDTAIFFSCAFAGTDMPWLTLAAGDLAFKLTMAIFLLMPFRLLLPMVLGTRTGASP
ncbi:MAG: VUT family protein [Proteobacteria bacterium]|nr:VUT family protein [Pseudomonadota bacterium]